MDAQIKSTADFQIFDGLLQATIVIDTKGTITYLNDAASKLFELAPADMLEKNVKNFMPQQFAQQHDTYINNYITTGKRKIIGEGRDVPVKAKSGAFYSDSCDISLDSNFCIGTHLQVTRL